jgi:alpha-ketoglutarate-dependent taurine dioxygenase
VTDVALSWPSDAPTLRGPPDVARRRRTPRPATPPLSLTPLHPTIGVVIGGLNLARPLEEEDRDFVRDAILGYKVVFIAAASRPSLSVIRALATQVAGDATPGSTELQAARLGDEAASGTVWTDVASAYAALPDAVRAWLQGRYVAHDVFAGPRLVEALAPHPIVRRHPQTGRSGLAADFTRSPRIIGVSRAEGGEILTAIRDLYRDPEHHAASPRLAGIALWDGLAATPTPAAPWVSTS